MAKNLLSQFFSVSPIWGYNGLGTVRIIFGCLIVYHGLEVFDKGLMQGYMDWDTFKGPNAALLVYAGKTSELLAGISILFGFFTRLGCILAIGTFSFITFFVGLGRFWYEDQHPFLFVLFGLLFIFTGPGALSIDRVIFGKDKKISGKHK